MDFTQLTEEQRRAFDADGFLVVPNALVEVWVKQHLARKLGIAANIKTERLGGFLREVARVVE